MDIARKVAAWFLIPRGYYCHSDADMHDVCPFWSMDRARDEQNNGYCSYMGRGDWDINEDKRWTPSIKQPDGTFLEGDTPQSGYEIGLPMSLLWDQCKECGVKC